MTPCPNITSRKSREFTARPVTVAIGSVMASTVATSTPVANGALAIGALLIVQAVIATMRRHPAAGRARR